MLEVNETVVTADEVAQFYKRYPGFWFLLEVIKTENKKASLMRVVRYNKSKEALRDFLLDELSDTNSKYIFVYADPDGKCEL